MATTRVTSQQVGDGMIATVDIADAAVTLAKQANVATSTVFYRKTAGTGVPEVQTVATLKTDLGLTGTNSGDQTITLTGDVTGSGIGSFAATIANDAVTYAKMQNVSATDKVLGRATAGAGNVEEIACTAAGRALIDDADASAQRTTLGLGTAAVKNTGTSGNNVPLLDGANTFSAAQTLRVTDAVTAASTTVLALYHTSSGTAADGFGTGLLFGGESSTTDDQTIGLITATWATAAHGTRKGRMSFFAYGTSNNEYLRGETSGAAPMIGFLGNAASIVQSGDIATALTTFGLMTGTVTLALANTTGTLPIGNIPAGMLRGYIDGLITSRATSTTVTVGAGCARDSTDAYSLYLSAATTKTFQASGAWTAGTGNNGLDTGAIGAAVWYHVWLIATATGGSVDVLFSLSATAPTMPSTYTLKRRIGSIYMSDVSTVTSYTQVGNEFTWDIPVADIVATNPGTAAVTRTLTVPNGVKVKVLFAASCVGSVAADNAAGVYISDLSVTDSVASIVLFNPMYGYSGAAAGYQFGVTGSCWTNTSKQVRSRIQISTASTTLRISTNGWIDPRGQNL